MKGSVLVLLVLVALCSALVSVPKIEVAGASATVYIKPDGAIDPSSASMTRNGDTYALTDNISSDFSGIIVERDNLTLDGAFYTLQGTGGQYSRGLDLSARRNVTIVNARIRGFSVGIELAGSSENVILNNDMIDNQCSIEMLVSSGNSVLENNITENNGSGISLVHSSGNRFVGNSIGANSLEGMKLSGYSSQNNISRNSITANQYGISLSYSSDNSISENAFADDGLFVRDSYGNSVQNNVVNGKPLVYLEGRSNQDVVDAGQVVLVNCSNIRVENSELCQASIGLELWRTNDCRIAGNNITANNQVGIGLYGSSNNSIVANAVGASSWSSIWFETSSNNTVAGNNLTHSGEGIWLDGSLNNSVVGNSLASNQFGIRLHGFSCFNSICENNIVSNSWAGVRLQDSSNNSVCRNDIADNWEGLEIKSSSDSNSIIGNTLRNNGYGIWFERTLDNKIYHNNFMDDNPQVYLGASAYANVWDDGCPSGGNYWRYYKGVDFRSGPYQNETGSDGIADASYTIDVNNTDRYPLMAPFNDFSVGTWNGVACSVDVISNYTVSGLSVEMTQKAISFRVIGQAEAGFCRVTIPNVIVQELWGGNYTVLLNDEPCSLSDWTDTRNTYIYVNCTGSTHELSIIPEYTSVLILSLFMLTMPIALFLRRKRTYQGKRQESRAGFKSQE